MSDPSIKIDVLGRNNYLFAMMNHYVGKIIADEPYDIPKGILDSAKELFAVAVDGCKETPEGSMLEALATYIMVSDLSDAAGKSDEEKEKEIKTLARLVLTIDSVKPSMEDCLKLKGFFDRAERGSIEYSSMFSSESKYTFTR